MRFSEHELTFYFDADCGICTLFAQWACRRTNADLRSISENSQRLEQLGVEKSELLLAALAYSESTGLRRGPAAIATLFEAAANRWIRLLGRVVGAPEIRPAATWAYGLIAANRGAISTMLGLNRCKI